MILLRLSFGRERLWIFSQFLLREHFDIPPPYFLLPLPHLHPHPPIPLSSPFEYDDDEAGTSMKLKMQTVLHPEKERSSLSTASSASKGEISNVSSSVGHLGVGVNNPALETTPMGTLERKKAAEAESGGSSGYVETEGL